MRHPQSYDSTPETRQRMAHVHLKNGKAEQLLAKRLWHLGFRYRKNDKRLPGSPDIVMPKHRIVIFIDGEFWHGKDWVARKPRLQRNRDYWIEKIEENIARDNQVNHELWKQGWTVLRFWEKEVLKHTDDCVEKVLYLCSLTPDSFDDEEWTISE